MLNRTLITDDPEAQRFINLSYVTNTEKIPQNGYIIFFIGWFSKKDGKPFKVESVHNYGKMKSLQNDGYSDIDKSNLLTLEEIISCLNYNYLSIENNEEIWYKSSKMGANKLKIILQQIVINIGINFDSNQKITNYNVCCTAIMILKASDIPEDEVMIFSGYHSQEAIQSYSSLTEDQHLSSIALLILYTAYNEDFKSYYTFSGDSYNYINYKLDKNEGTIVLL
ncbi:14586_t:CDS:2 [Cetraspora pellucida]|uniref:14586_t:CDS:1 n=1 Tax=Cetraspora pellucida TaxID=1433469 RepID=A0A9N9G309_9GLOM|nr:14586_t:CDS:2 [Cetraspora pellucida]